MKKIRKDELYKNLSGFLSDKGVEFKDGPYTSRIRQGCSLLSDCINYTQSGIGKAKTKIDEKLDRMRQIIHEKTAPAPVKTPKAKAKPARKPAKAAAKPAAAPAKSKPVKSVPPKEVKPE